MPVLNSVWWRTCVLFRTRPSTGNKIYFSSEMQCTWEEYLWNVSGGVFFLRFFPSFVMVGMPHHLCTDKDQIDLWEAGMQKAEQAVAAKLEKELPAATNWPLQLIPNSPACCCVILTFASTNTKPFRESFPAIHVNKVILVFSWKFLQIFNLIVFVYSKLSPR